MAAVLFVSCVTTPAQSAEAIQVPSGQRVSFQEVLLDDALGSLSARFRFVAPQISRDGGEISHEQAAPDMDHLCETLALDYLASHNLAPERVIISMSDRPVAFGERDQAVTQFFEVYRPEGTSCIWEAF